MTAGYRKCDHSLEYGDSVCHMTEVNKGARKIMTEVPDELTSMITWTVLASVFILLLMAATCLVLTIESTANELPVAVHLVGESPAVANKTARKLCSYTDLHVTLEQLDAACRKSELMTLQGVSVDDVHYVFADTATVPWVSVCSLESALRAVGNNSRVNVFVVSGIEDQLSLPNDAQNSVSLSTGLSKLMAKYGADRLKVVQIELEACLACSPFRDELQNLKRQFEMAKFAVQLTVLWQFGGTVLDSSVVVVRNHVYRANGTAVEYGNRTVSVPAACHTFVFDVMMYAMSSKWQQLRPFGPEIMWNLMEQTEHMGHNNKAQPMPHWVVSRGTVDDSCYYIEMGNDGGTDLYHNFCPHT